MPLAVHVTVPPQLDRNYFGLAEDAFVFLFYFDFASYSTRKNPYAVVDAFRRAFDGRSDKVSLVVKSTGLDPHKQESVKMREALDGDPRITLIDKVISHEEIAALVNCCDSFVSLHRSEGFGRGLAEAMFLGKPVIATNYSGNTDFTREDTACLVNYALVPVEPGDYPESKGQVWADPDIEHAAWHMRRLVEDSAAARRLAAAGKKYIHENHSLAHVGAKYRERLERLGLWSCDAPKRQRKKKTVVRS
jgi:glycosyltransferase involved in cell wall biosynthesis